MTWVAVSIGASAVVGGISAFTGGKASTEQAASNAKMEQLKIDEAKKSEKLLEPAKTSKQVAASQDFQYSSEQVGMGKEDAQKKLDSVIQKSGLATSAGATGFASDIWKKIQHAEKGLMGQLGKAMGGIEEWYEGEKSKIEGIIKRSTLQKQNFEKAAGGWYLGKNIGSVFSDRKLKKDIKYVGTLENNLNLYEFQYVWGGPRRTGIMADEVEKLYPEAVTTHPNGFQSVDYTLIT